MTRSARTLALVLGAVLVTGCGSGSEALRPAASTPAAGTHRVECQLQSDHGFVTVVLDLPSGFVEGPPEDREAPPGGCAWHLPVEVPEDGDFDGDPSTQDTFSSDVVLTLEEVTSKVSLDQAYDDVEGDASDEVEGDDSIVQLRRERGVATFGRTRGDRLSYLCFCDGQNTLSRYAQADGILLAWGSENPLRRRTDRMLDAVLASIGTDPRS